MKFNFLLTLQLTFAILCTGQSYQINYFQFTYDTLVDYNSVNIELALAGEEYYVWEKSFDFGFEFPFYHDTFNSVELSSNSVGFFPGSPEYNLELFSGNYTIADILDTPYLYSEMRYVSTVANQLNALVVEFHNVYLFSEYSDNGENHSINYQLWFYENGIIEVHIGQMDLNECSYYFPGEGFSFDNEDPTGNIYGPWISINNNNFSESACFGGDHTNPSILYDDYDNCDVLTSIPPEGFVVQFIPSHLVAVQRIDADAENLFRCISHDGLVEIVGDESQFKSCTIFDSMGRKIGYSDQSKFSLDGNATQLYIVVIESEIGMETHKLIMK
jgi:hypothetical protein